MIQILQLILLTSLFCIGLYVSTSPGYLLGPIKSNLAYLLGGEYREVENEIYFEFKGIMKHLWKPFLGCITCMASFWGIVIYFIFVHPSINTIYELPIQIIAASGINNIISKWLNL